MFKFLGLFLTLAFFAGCYEVRYQTPVYLNGSFEQAHLAEERPTKLCATITYKLKSGTEDVIETEKKCDIQSTLQNGQLSANFKFILHKKADFYNVTNLTQIDLQTETPSSTSCQDCAVTTIKRIYSGTLKDLNSTDQGLFANLLFTLTSESSSQQWVSSYEQIVRGCSVFEFSEIRSYCIELRTLPQIARACKDSGFERQGYTDEMKKCLYQATLN